MAEYKVRATHVNATDDESRVLIAEVIEEYSAPNKRALMFQLQKEYGKIISKLYRETPDGKVNTIGWVLAKKRQYEDSKDTYLHEVWAEVL